MNFGFEGKRKRQSSGGTTLTAQHVTENLHCYGEIILKCCVNITGTIRDSGNTLVLKYVCALLNSGGGILHMRNLDAERGAVQSKHLDTWWSGMEIKMAEILSRDDICNYFDLVGNHDDHNLYLFVKTAEHLCTLSYHCKLPTDTATHDVTYQSLMRLLVSGGESGSLLELPPIPDRFVFGQSAEELKKETKQIQFKQLSTPMYRGNTKTTLPAKIVAMMVKYVSAFANHEGGHIYFGINDSKASVIGEELNPSEQKHLEHLIASGMRAIIWRDVNIQAIRGLHWDVRFFPVINSPKKSHRVVVVVSVIKYPGGVFTHCPISCYVNVEGRVQDFTFVEWKDAIHNPLRDVPELHHRFTKLSLMVPQAPLVFTLPNTVTTIINKVFLGKPGEIQPRQYIENYTPPQYRDTVRNILSYFKGNNCVCIGMECWGLKIPMVENDSIICDVAIVTELDGIQVLTFSLSQANFIYQHSQKVAALLKNKLVQLGGCVEKFPVYAHVIDISQPDTLQELDSQMSHRSIYPSHFSSNQRKFNKILQSVAICMGVYMAKSQVVTSMNENGSYHFVLTHDQFELLWTQQFIKELWVHGPAGAGKTVAAVQMIQELRRRGCRNDNILYLAENEHLCDFVRSHNLCLVSTRRELLTDNQNLQIFHRKYSTICNVIVDEAQHFRDWDGDWYSLAEKLSNQNTGNSLHRCSHYFWLFMDYSQKVHKFKAGLPSVIGKNNFMLSEVSRSTKEIFDFTSKLMMASEHVEGLMSPLPSVQSLPKLAHNFSSGKGVDILSCKESEMDVLLNRVLSGLLKNGVQEGDIAILVGKKKELDHVQSAVSSICPNTTSVTRKQSGQIVNSSSVEEHLQKCGSDASLTKRRLERQHSLQKNTNASADDLNTADNTEDDVDDLSDISSDESFDTDNPFSALEGLDSMSELDEEINDKDNELVASSDPTKPNDSTAPNEASKSSDTHTRKQSPKPKQRLMFYQQDSLIEEEDELQYVTEIGGSGINVPENNNKEFTKDRSETKDTELEIGDAEANLAENSKLNKGFEKVSRDSDSITSEGGIAIETVKKFSGLDKAAVIGINPYVNEEHADFKKFILNLATRAKDNLIIITTSDNIKRKLDSLAK